MKKLNTKSFLIAAVALLLGGGAFTAQALSKIQAQESDLVRANVEALADGEVSAGYVYSISHNEGQGDPFLAGGQTCVPCWTSVTCHGEGGTLWCQSSYSSWTSCS